MKPPRVRSVVVVADRAGVGKTLVTCAIVHALCRAGVQAIAMKPAAQGCIGDDGAWCSAEVGQLAAVSAFGLPQHVLCPAIVPLPREAATVRRVPPTLDSTVDTFRILATWADAVVIEGADELRAALELDFGSADLAGELQLPFVAVVDPAAAHAAHQPLALARAGLECAGWIANRSDEPVALARLARDMQWPLLGAIPTLREPTPALASGALNTARLLRSLAPIRTTRHHAT